ncbi:MAG: hypothetical protein CMI55_03195 [Parcubacteria group bacterium]|jgi:acyl carrier protein phosphodiesterase|nr:hypothetical protein [Parcubacteria group bacterium]|tara:strand:+ start:248 stop:661 length:414 start_codon:yes stop_codon:yes gene_type:complete
MKQYKTKVRILTGKNYPDLYKKAFSLYRQIKRKTKRKPYIRSFYFRKDKIFLDLFWQHLHQKNWRDRKRRIRYYPCAIELIRYSRLDPASTDNPNNPSEILHKFSGIAPDGSVFYVQIKENKRNNQKYLMSVFPEQK